MNAPFANAVELDSVQLAEIRQLKLDRLRLLQEQENAVKEFGLKYYKPHAKQDAFHRAGKYKRRAVFAGNRFGKSDCGAAEDCAQFIGYRPWYPSNDEARTAGIPNRPQKGLVLTTDWGKVNSIFTNDRGGQPGKLWKFLPRGFVKHKVRNHSGCYDYIVGENGSSITFDVVEAFKKSQQSAESDDFDWIHIDEPIPKKMFDAHGRGLVDRHGSAWFTLTPLREPWIYDYFFGDEDTRKVVERAACLVLNEVMWSVTGSMWDNPYLSAEAINQFLDDLDDEGERECRESGIPLQFSGLIYKEFEDHLHKMQKVPEGWEEYDKPPRDWPVYLQLDPHPQTPTAGLLCTVDPDSERKYIFDEIWCRGTCDDITQNFLSKLDHRYLVRALGDPSIFNNDKLTGSCAADDFALAGLWMERAVKDLERGIRAVKRALKLRCKDGLPMWVFSPLMKRFFYEIKRWHWDKENKPIDKNDHTLECLYRMVLDNPTFVRRTSDTFIDPADQPIRGLEREERFQRESLTNFDY